MISKDELIRKQNEAIRGMTPEELVKLQGDSLRALSEEEIKNKQLEALQRGDFENMAPVSKKGPEKEL